MDDYQNSTIYALVPRGKTLESANGFVYISYCKCDYKLRVSWLKAQYRKNKEKSNCRMLFDKYGTELIDCIVIKQGSFENRSRLIEATNEAQLFYPCINKYVHWKKQSSDYFEDSV